jgi:YD repeat-containing protein
MAEPQYAAERYDFVSGVLIYRAGNTLSGASESDTSWFVYKYTWDESGNLSAIRGPIKGAWTNRASMAW